MFLSRLAVCAVSLTPALRTIVAYASGILVALALLISPRAHASEDYLLPEEAFILSTNVTDAATGALTLHWKIAPGYYLYAARIGATAVPAGIPPTLDIPAGVLKDDPNFGEMAVFYRSVSVPVHAPGAQAIEVTWQGCADAGLCYPPQTQLVPITPSTHTRDASAPSQTASSSFTPLRLSDRPTPDTAAPASLGASLSTLLPDANSNDSQLSQWLHARSLLWSIPLFFVLGIALAFTPCVLPMVPIVSSIVVGSQATPKRALMLSLAFVLPMALTYAALGAIAASAGANLQAILQNPWTLGLFGLIFVVLAMAMFGFFTLQLPAFLRDKLDHASRTKKGGTLVGAALMGWLSALLVGPCMTAPLAGILLYIAQTGNVLSGTLLLFALGIGMGVPLLAIGTLGARYLPRPGPWMDVVKGAFGFMLLGTAIWMMERVVSPALSLALWGALLLGLAVALKHIASQGAIATRLLCQTAFLLSGLWGGALLVGAAMGNHDILRPLAISGMPRTSNTPDGTLTFDVVTTTQAFNARMAAAKAARQPVMVDFSAQWCITCKKIERTVYTAPQVHAALAGVTRIQVDVTDNTQDQRALMRAHHVVGPPTVMLFDQNGQEIRDARLIGEFDTPLFLQRLLALTPQPPSETK